MVSLSLTLRLHWINLNPDFFCHFQSQEIDQKIAETWKHIQTERKILEATQLLRQATTNQDVLRRNDAKIRETERSLAYFEDTLRELQARKAQLMQRDDPSRFQSPSSPQVCWLLLQTSNNERLNTITGSAQGTGS